MTPQKPEGKQASADAGMRVAIRLIEQAYVAYGSTTERGKACHQMLGIAGKHFGPDQGSEIVPAELKAALLQPAGDAQPKPGVPGAPAAAPGGAPSPAGIAGMAA